MDSTVLFAKFFDAVVVYVVVVYGFIISDWNGSFSFRGVASIVRDPIKLLAKCRLLDVHDFIFTSILIGVPVGAVFVITTRPPHIYSDIYDIFQVAVFSTLLVYLVVIRIRDIPTCREPLRAVLTPVIFVFVLATLLSSILFARGGICDRVSSSTVISDGFRWSLAAVGTICSAIAFIKTVLETFLRCSVLVTGLILFRKHGRMFVIRGLRLWDSALRSLRVDGFFNTSKFSSGNMARYIEGYVNGTLLEAFPDSGADVSFISAKLANQLHLVPRRGTHRTIHLPNKRSVKSPGMVEIPWTFKGESKLSNVQAWILPGSVHDLALGNPFLRQSETLTTFKHRIKSRMRGLSSRLCLNLLGRERQRLWGSLNGRRTLALPDTGSDLMLISRAYARRLNLKVDTDSATWLEVEFADGSTGQTSGIARREKWTVGDKTVRCDFHVLDNLWVDLVLSNNYLFEMDIFTNHQDCFLDVDSGKRATRFSAIRLIGKASKDSASSQTKPKGSEFTAPECA